MSVTLSGRGLKSRLPVVSLVLCLPACADFSYIRTTKSSATAVPEITKQSLKGQKMRMERGDVASIVDLGARTVTTINSKRKVYTVHKLPAASDPASAAALKSPASPKLSVDVRESGKKKKIGAYNAKEVVLTLDGGASPISGDRMQMEADIWISSDVPGMHELQAFQHLGNSLSPVAAPAGADMQKIMSDIQRETAGMDGVPLLQITRVRTSKGGPAVVEMTMETAGFSTAPVPDSLFAIPAGYRKLGTGTKGTQTAKK